ncbi:MAG: hypothetical protein HOJ90_02045 [Alphaproteobacteria bacterium]|jgi:hypothetical protein|nr:hypothetical protein [Alphaproteobacteria bacterium]
MLLRTKLNATVIAGALLVWSSVSGAQSAYLADVDDLPLAPGLVEDSAARVAFDKPAGRIVEAAAGGSTTAAAVRDFYRQTLPALGWQAVAQNSWARGEESLKIQVDRDGPPVIVRYSLSPRDR